MNEVQRQEEIARKRALQEFEDTTELSYENLEALMAWVGMDPEDLTHPSYVRAAVHAASKTARYYKSDHRNTAFARKMRLRRGTAVINITSMRRIVENEKFINLTIMHVPEPQTYNRRKRDMRVCADFLDKVAKKFLATHFFAHELLQPRMLATLGLLPDELAAAERSYERLVRLVQASKLKPSSSLNLGFMPLLYTTRKRYTNRKRRDRLSCCDFVAITHAMESGEAKTAQVAAQLGVGWSDEDQDRMIRIGRQLRPHLYREYVEIPLGYRYV